MSFLKISQIQRAFFGHRPTFSGFPSACNDFLRPGQSLQAEYKTAFSSVLFLDFSCPFEGIFCYDNSDYFIYDRRATIVPDTMEAREGSIAVKVVTAIPVNTKDTPE